MKTEDMITAWDSRSSCVGVQAVPALAAEERAREVIRRAAGPLTEEDARGRHPRNNTLGGNTGSLETTRTHLRKHLTL
jgi:hypothetical protein